MVAKTELAQLQALPDPLLNFRWVVQESFAGLPKSYVERVDLPFSNIQVREGIYNASSFTYFPGFHNISAFSMSFYEDKNATVLSWINQWKNKIKDFNTGLYKLPSTYKRDLKVHLLDQTGEDVMIVQLKGLFPAETSNLPLEYTSSNRITIEQQFSCDDGVIEFMKTGLATFI